MSTSQLLSDVDAPIQRSSPPWSLPIEKDERRADRNMAALPARHRRHGSHQGLPQPWTPPVLVLLLDMPSPTRLPSTEAPEAPNVIRRPVTPPEAASAAGRGARAGPPTATQGNGQAAEAGLPAPPLQLPPTTGGAAAMARRPGGAAPAHLVYHREITLDVPADQVSSVGSQGCAAPPRCPLVFPHLTPFFIQPAHPPSLPARRWRKPCTPLCTCSQCLSVQQPAPALPQARAPPRPPQPLAARQAGGCWRMRSGRRLWAARAAARPAISSSSRQGGINRARLRRSRASRPEWLAPARAGRAPLRLQVPQQAAGTAAARPRHTRWACRPTSRRAAWPAVARRSTHSCQCRRHLCHPALLAQEHRSTGRAPPFPRQNRLPPAALGDGQQVDRSLPQPVLPPRPWPSLKLAPGSSSSSSSRGRGLLLPAARQVETSDKRARKHGSRRRPCSACALQRSIHPSAAAGSP